MDKCPKKPWIDVRKLRESRGWIQQEAAEELGVSRAYVAAVEIGKRGISMSMMSRLIRVFKVKYEDFFQ